ncbi:helix-turn-helix domain-containing protein [Spirosoma sp.]|uniref:helix-turn-helix domain-containing protein n=1 Tax=Spirosoma sp. TaxID=1899569 RepID=UPI003B3A0E6A
METDKKQTVPNILIKFAQQLGTEVKNGRVQIPEKLGTGYCAGFVLNKSIRLLISNYEINEELVVKNPEIDTTRRMIFFKFQNIFPKTDKLMGKRLPETPSVLIATSRINTDDIISIHSNTSTINIEVDAEYLKESIELSEKTPVLQSLLENTQPLLFEELIFSSLQHIVDEIVNEAVDEALELFFLKIKSEELICRLLIELTKREEKQLLALNGHDISTIYKLKEQMLEHLATPPVIHKLAVTAHMSPSKLKRLFKQIFGKSIFRYYQEFRMKEAARLLKEEKLSVSEVGYQLGFTNLSHFSRAFNEHIGAKPKQYSRS